MRNIYNIEIGDNFSVNYMTNDMIISNLNNPFFIKFNEVGLTSFPMKKEGENIKKEQEIDLEKKDVRNELMSNIINQELLKAHID